MSVLELKNLEYRYTKHSKNVISNIDYSFEEGKIYAIIGKSGAGKTTLLSLLSGLAKPTGGEILYNGKNIAKIDKYRFRSTAVGVVFQSYNLLPYLNAKENVILSMDIASAKIKDKKARADELLKKVGISEEESRRSVLKLSGGQQQRVAIARALSHKPQIILADEPTGNLDAETQEEIMQLLRTLANEGKCVIVVTHSPEVSKSADIVYELKKQN